MGPNMLSCIHGISVMDNSVSGQGWFLLINQNVMEDTITKRYFLLLTAALCLFVCAAALGEETEPAVHSDDHVTVEVAEKELEIIRTDSPETHACVVHYNLYCVNCSKVILYDVRKEETAEAHYWTVSRVEPGCETDGRETKKCLLCGYVLETPLTAPGHQWSDWIEDEIDPALVCVTDVTARRVCQVCGQEETKVVTPAPGHPWPEGTSYPPTCTEPGRVKRVCPVCGQEEVITLSNSPALGHLFADVSVLMGHPAGDVSSSSEYPGIVIGTVISPATCTQDGSGILLCARCQDVSRSVTIPSSGHDWAEWQANPIPEDAVCETDATSTRTCKVCRAEETRVDAAAPGHRWATVSYTMPTCTEAGTAKRRCSVCGKETTVESPALGHSYVWIEVSAPTPTSDGVSEYTCAVCGNVADTRKVAYVQMMYNNTIASFGPTLRDLIGGNVWNRVTPIDLSQEGVFTYPLIASNRYTVGTATVVIEQGMQTVTYRLNSSSIMVHSESLVIYPSAEALRTGEKAESFAFGVPIDISYCFGEDRHVIMSIILKADYNAAGFGVQSFTPDQAQIDAMIALLD